MCMTRVRIASPHLSSDELPATRGTPAPSSQRLAAHLSPRETGTSKAPMSSKCRKPTAILDARWTRKYRGFEMFLSTDDIVALHSQVSELHRAIVHQERVLAELQRLGEPTALAEKFLVRLQAQLAARQHCLDSLTNSAANENI